MLQIQKRLHLFWIPALLVILVALTVSIALSWWTPDKSYAADYNGTVRFRVYANGTPVSGASGQLAGVNHCSGTPINVQGTTNASGQYLYSYSGSGCSFESPFCTSLQAFSKAGYTNVGIAIDAGNTNPSGTTGICGAIPSAGGVLSFTVQMTPNPTLDFSANATSIVKGGTAVLSWNSANATVCNATSGNLNTNGAKTGSQSVQPAQTTTYTIKCDKAGTPSATKSVTITVTNPPAATTKKPTSSGSKPKTTPAPAPAIVNPNASDTVAPAAPDKLEAKAGKGVIILSWPEVSDDVGVTGYSIERSTDGLEWEYIAQNVQDTSYTDDDLEPDTYYFYRVRAQDAAGNQSEPVFSEAVLSAATVAAAKPDTASPAGKKKSSGGPVAAIVITLVLLAAGAGVWWLRRRSARDAGLYDYDSVPLPQQPATTAPQDRAEHTSMSLKDMVMQDYHPDDPRNKPGPHPPGHSQ